MGASSYLQMATEKGFLDVPYEEFTKRFVSQELGAVLF
jgi:hypothetical protein